MKAIGGGERCAQVKISDFLLFHIFLISTSKVGSETFHGVEYFCAVVEILSLKTAIVLPVRANLDKN